MGYKIGKDLMKKYSILCWLAALALSMQAGTLQEHFLKANTAYDAGNISEALKEYEAITPKGSAVLYNMGNCYYQLGNHEQAILHWRQAQKDASWRDLMTLESLISLSCSAMSKVYSMSFTQRCTRAFKHMLALFSLLVFQLLFLFFWVFLPCSLPRLLHKRRYYMIACMSICMVFACFVLVVKYREINYPYGLVSKNSISVYAGPGPDYARITEAKILDEVRVCQVRGDWVKVYKDHVGYGWIKTADLVML
jgi:hypothetical protein